MNDSIRIYLDEIGKVPLLTAAEERELSRAIEAGRDAQEKLDAGQTGAVLTRQVRVAAHAKDRFIQSNLRLVVSLARRYPLPPSLDLLDLIQEGNLGLERAVDKFDWRKGFKFSTYATFWIRQAIGRGLDRSGSTIRLPGDRAAALRSALRQAADDGSALDPAAAELHLITTPTSLNRSLTDSSDATLGDLVTSSDATPEDQVITLADHEKLTELLDELEPRARFAVKAYYGLLTGEAQSFREISEHLGVANDTARRLVRRAIATLEAAATESSVA